MGDATDVLVAALDAAARGEESDACDRIRSLQRDTAAVLRDFFGPSAGDVEREIEGNFAELERMARAVAVLRSVPAASRDHFLAHGERISAAVVARALSARGLSAVTVDSREIMITDDRFGRARPDEEEIEKRARQRLLPRCARG